MSSSFAFLIFPTRLHAMSCIAQKLNNTNLDGWRICMTLLENNDKPCDNQVPESYGKLLLAGVLCLMVELRILCLFLSKQNMHCIKNASSYPIAITPVSGTAPNPMNQFHL